MVDGLVPHDEMYPVERVAQGFTQALGASVNADTSDGS